MVVTLHLINSCCTVCLLYLIHTFKDLAPFVPESDREDVKEVRDVEICYHV